MLEPIEALSRHLRTIKDRPFRRSFFRKWNLEERLTIIVGPRGVGKSTCMVQWLKDRSPGGGSLPGLFVQVDHVAMTDVGLYELAVEYAQLGGRLLGLDEVHKRPGWEVQLKSVYETLPALQVVASGSSALEIHKGSHDLSRRAVIAPMQILSFREFVALRTGIEHEPVDLDGLVDGHADLAPAILASLAPVGRPILSLFQEYLRSGSYPYFLDFREPETFLLAVEQNVRTTIESDLLAIHPTLTGASARRIRRLLSIVASSVPFVPDLRHLADLLGVGDERTLKTYLKYLEDAGLVRSLSRGGGGLRALEKPEKVYLHSPSLCHAMAAGRSPDAGSLRETFLLSMLAPGHRVTAPPAGDFRVDDRLTIEVGGRNKTAFQLRDVPDALLAIDGIETGSRRRVPLWMFGWLY